MNKNSLFRKIAYITAIVVLLGPLFALGRPGQGLIGQLRSKHRMGQADIGKLDPTSESMRLATLGLKGIASTILWLRADYYKEEKYFDRFSATLNQIGLLQPHFVSVWEHQAHNLSYNMSPEFEDYRQRYEWVKKGIDYLVRGAKFNDRKPILQYDLGQQYFGYKFGKADERKQYRSLYRADNEFHKYLKNEGLVGIDSTALGYDNRPDNWLTGKLWLNKATDLYEAGASIKKVAHLLYSYAPNWQMYYAEAIEDEGILDSSAKFAWKQGGVEWEQFGTRTLYQFREGRELTLLSLNQAIDEAQKIQDDFNAMTKDVKEIAISKRRAKIPADKLADYENFQGSVEEEERMKNYSDVAFLLRPTAEDLALELPAKEQMAALALAKTLAAAKQFEKDVESYRQQVNYVYWEQRSKAEQMDETIEARRMIFEADKLIDNAMVKGAMENYEKAWTLWAFVFDKFPDMMGEEVGDAVIKSVRRYMQLTDAELDDTFPLASFLAFRKTDNKSVLGAELANKAPVLKRSKLNAAMADAIQETETPVQPPSEPVPTPTEKAETVEPQLPPTLENPDFQN